MSFMEPMWRIPICLNGENKTLTKQDPHVVWTDRDNCYAAHAAGCTPLQNVGTHNIIINIYFTFVSFSKCFASVLCK